MNKYHNLAREVASNSRCERDQVGAVIVKDDRVISVGWNQRVVQGECVRNKKCLPSGVRNDLSCCWHAEAHAIRQAMYAERSVVGAEMFVSREPCELCRTFLRECGVSKVHHKED